MRFMVITVFVHIVVFRKIYSHIFTRGKTTETMQMVFLIEAYKGRDRTNIKCKGLAVGRVAGEGN